MRTDCAIGQYCDLGSDCGGIDNQGVCRIVPGNCPTEEDTVCGCDNEAYTNQCVANTLGATVKHEGECIRTPTIENN